MELKVIRRAVAVSTIAACVILTPTVANANAWGYQSYGGGTLVHSITGSGRSALYQSATATNEDLSCKSRIDFTERTSSNGLIKRSTGTTIQGCVRKISRERYNITFASNTARACATFVGTFFGQTVQTVSQCHKISG